jgi:lysophospholipase L1-like esterase
MAARVLLLSFVFTCTLQSESVAQRQSEQPEQAEQAGAPSFKIPESDDGLPGVGPIRRYDWFKNLWKQRRSQWAAQATQDKGAVVFFGDSITQGWEPNYHGHFADLKKANRGISGDTTRGMLVRLDQDVLALQPQCVVMLMGTNDLEEGATPDQIASNFAEIIKRLNKHDPKLPIVVCEVFPSADEKKRPASDIQKINSLYREAVKGNRLVTIVDTYTLFANSKGDAKKEEFPDLLHPNAAGYAKWAKALNPVLATLGLTETTASESVLENGFEALFNGKDLTGWCIRPTTEAEKKQYARWKKGNPKAAPWPFMQDFVNLNETPASPDGRYRAINGRLVVTTPSEGRRIQQLWTQAEFDQDFELRLEFRATPNADSGIFIRGKQLQCRDFPLAGPYKTLKLYRGGDWNTITIVVTGDTARCTCNGEVLEEAFKIPASGPIGLEGDRGQMEYRNIRIKLL